MLQKVPVLNYGGSRISVPGSDLPQAAHDLITAGGYVYAFDWVVLGGKRRYSNRHLLAKATVYKPLTDDSSNVKVYAYRFIPKGGSTLYSYNLGETAFLTTPLTLPAEGAGVFLHGYDQDNEYIIWSDNSTPVNFWLYKNNELIGSIESGYQTLPAIIGACLTSGGIEWVVNGTQYSEGSVDYNSTFVTHYSNLGIASSELISQDAVMAACPIKAKTSWWEVEAAKVVILTEAPEEVTRLWSLSADYMNLGKCGYITMYGPPGSGTTRGPVSGSAALSTTLSGDEGTAFEFDENWMSLWCMPILPWGKTALTYISQYYGGPILSFDKVSDNITYADTGASFSTPWLQAGSGSISEAQICTSCIIRFGGDISIENVAVYSGMMGGGGIFYPGQEVYPYLFSANFDIEDAGDRELYLSRVDAVDSGDSDTTPTYISLQDVNGYPMHNDDPLPYPTFKILPTSYGPAPNYVPNQPIWTYDQVEVTTGDTTVDTRKMTFSRTGFYVSGSINTSLMPASNYSSGSVMDHCPDGSSVELVYRPLTSAEYSGDAEGNIWVGTIIKNCEGTVMYDSSAVNSSAQGGEYVILCSMNTAPSGNCILGNCRGQWIMQGSASADSMPFGFETATLRFVART